MADESKFPLRHIKFTDSQRSYLLYFFFFLANLLVISYFNHSFGGIVQAIFIILLILFCGILSMKIQYELEIPYIIQILAGLLLVSSINSVNNTGLPVFLVLLLISTPLFLFTSLPFFSNVYSMTLSYDHSTRELIISYDKLFTKIEEKIIIPESPILRLKPMSFRFPDFLIKKGLFHQLIIESRSLRKDNKNEDLKISIAPLSVNGFNLIHKIYQLLVPHRLSFNTIPQTNAKLVLPEIKNSVISLPISIDQEDYIPINKISEIINSDSLINLHPKYGLSSRVYPIFISGSLLFSIIFSIIFVMNIDLAPLYISFISILIIILIIIWITVFKNIIVVWFGTIEAELSDSSLTLTYSLRWIDRINITIDRGFDPKLEILDGVVYLIILDNRGDLFYQHCIGRLTSNHSH